MDPTPPPPPINWAHSRFIQEVRRIVRIARTPEPTWLLGLISVDRSLRTVRPDCEQGCTFLVGDGAREYMGVISPCASIEGYFTYPGRHC
jgi:hypothetical protein